MPGAAAAALQPRVRAVNEFDVGAVNLNGKTALVTGATSGLGLTLVHLSAQLEPCLTHKYILHTQNTPFTRATQPLRAPPVP
jgi:hypothetical protein